MVAAGSVVDGWSRGLPLYSYLGVHIRSARQVREWQRLLLGDLPHKVVADPL